MLARGRADATPPLTAKPFMKVMTSVYVTGNKHGLSFQNHVASLSAHHKDIRLLTGRKAKKQGITGTDRKKANEKNRTVTCLLHYIFEHFVL
jgi:hypothetical protein